MNNKVLASFIGGLVVASGITYFLMKRPDPGAVPAKTAVVSQVPAVVDTPSVTPAAEPESPSVDQPVEAEKPRPEERPEPAARTQRSPVLAKPSPINRSDRATPSPAPAPPVEVETPKPAPPTPVESARTREPEPAPTPVMPKLDPPPPPKANTVTIPAGTSLIVRMGETISTTRSRPGDTFAATLDQPLVVDGFVIAERGARAQGRVVEADRSGRVRGVALLQVELVQISTADGQRVKVNTSFIEKKAETTRKSDAAKVGIGAALGAAIGAMAGGGKGAAVGAGAGGAAGAGDVLLTRGKDVEFPVESRVSFRLAEALTLTEKLR